MLEDTIAVGDKYDLLTRHQPTSIYKQGLVRLSLGGGCSYERDEACEGARVVSTPTRRPRAV